jgi:hypothetical protein
MEIAVPISPFNEKNNTWQGNRRRTVALSVRGSGAARVTITSGNVHCCGTKNRAKGEAVWRMKKESAIERLMMPRDMAARNTTRREVHESKADQMMRIHENSRIGIP